MDEGREKVIMFAVFAGIVGIGAVLIVLSDRQEQEGVRELTQADFDLFAPCYAEANALRTHIYALQEEGWTPEPTFLSALEARFNTLRRRYGLYDESNDPRRAELQGAVAEAARMRDTALAENPDLYRQTAWAEVVECHSQLFPETAP